MEFFRLERFKKKCSHKNFVPGTLIATFPIPFGNIDYEEFLNGIVPPRNEAEFTIYGPTLDLLPDKGTIGIFLYDVVTATDVAGNTTQKQNYEWYFDCQAKTEEATGEVRTTQGFIDDVAV
jgi:hypothetical protein